MEDNVNYFEALDLLCENETNYSDKEFAQKFTEAIDTIPIEYEISHMRSSQIISRRAMSHCKKKGIALEKYDGPLPYKLFLIPVGTMQEHKAKENLDSLKHPFTPDPNDQMV